MNSKTLKTNDDLKQLVDEFLKKVRNILPEEKSSDPTHKPLFLPKTASEVASLIDHTLLKADATTTEIRKLCEEAVAYKFASVCVNSLHVHLAAELIKESGVKAVSVVGFPLGAMLASAKAYEAAEAIRNGAQEIDMVLAIGALKSGQYDTVFEDIRAVVEAAGPYPVKVILETSLLSENDKIIACALAKTAGAAFVKTSTGFGGGGATTEDITLMRKVVGPKMGVKASGGIRSYDDARKMIEAGATRLGTSASIAIVQGNKENGGY